MPGIYSSPFTLPPPLAAAMGRDGGIITVHKFGRSEAVGTTEGVIINGTAPAPFLTAAATVRVASGGNAADTAAGAGAREVTFSGLDATGAMVSEAVPTAGTSASASTTTEFIRMPRVYVSSAGAYATPYNTGDMKIETTAGVELVTIPAERGQSQIGFYTIPLGYTGYLAEAGGRVESGKAATVRLYQRQNILDTTVPVNARRLVQEWPGVSGDTFGGTHSTWERYPALTDIIMTGETTSGTTRVNVEFELYLVPDSY